jgi:KRAB domain-containing zinc finger protein
MFDTISDFLADEHECEGKSVGDMELVPDGSKLFTCEECKMTFRNEDSLDAHECLKCETCGKFLNSKAKLQNHILVFHTKKEDWPFQCNECKETFKTKKEFGDHRETLHGWPREMSVCNGCGDMYDLPESLEIHAMICGDLMKLREEEEQEKREKEKIRIEREQRKQERIQKQKEMDSLEMDCPHCGEHIVGMLKYQDHVVGEHQDLKPWKCGKCPKEYAFLGLLKHHEKKHVGQGSDDMFECDVCGKKCTSRSVLNTHKKFVHSDEKPCKCIVCGARFKNQGKLNDHMYRHTAKHGIWRHHCLCGYTCNGPDSMREHLARNTGPEHGKRKMKRDMQQITKDLFGE